MDDFQEEYKKYLSDNAEQVRSLHAEFQEKEKDDVCILLVDARMRLQYVGEELNTLK